MATQKTPAPVVPIDERVEVMIPRGNANDDPNFFVSVNGVNYLLPKGKKSKVPRWVADEINRSFAAQEALDARMQKMLEESQQ